MYKNFRIGILINKKWKFITFQEDNCPYRQIKNSKLPNPLKIFNKIKEKINYVKHKPYFLHSLKVDSGE